MNKKKRQQNKSNGPWGIKEFDITYRKLGDTVKRQRFIHAVDEESALEQFDYICNKSEFAAEIVSIVEVDN
tara:strand:- start:459 stop:671 length:213 start_codon:yes stop_codon:yes gene_type:complete